MIRAECHLPFVLLLSSGVSSFAFASTGIYLLPSPQFLHHTLCLSGSELLSAEITQDLSLTVCVCVCVFVCISSCRVIRTGGVGKLSCAHMPLPPPPLLHLLSCHPPPCPSFPTAPLTSLSSSQPPLSPRANQRRADTMNRKLSFVAVMSLQPLSRVDGCISRFDITKPVCLCVCVCLCV